MRLPRRVPWANISELDQLCSWVFMDEGDLEAKRFAINRLSAWRAVTALPHALESTLSILTARLLDTSETPQNSSWLSLRQNYAAAIIRMVNGLVDPLQAGAYARSIASIAAQLGLPSWLVELRHAATHEDLPSLEMLREAARESLTWLLHNYFLPTINPSAPRPSTAPPLRPVTPLLKQYKTLLKLVTRDASLRKQHQPDIDAIMRDVERWLAEAKLAADFAADAYGWDTIDGNDIEQEDPREKWALERFCDALVGKGALVSLSQKKRTLPSDEFVPPHSSLALWTPLLAHTQTYHPTFPSVLTTRIMENILYEPPNTGFDMDVVSFEVDDSQNDPSYHLALAKWAAWVIKTYDHGQENGELSLRKNLIVLLASTLAPGKTEGVKKIEVLAALLRAVTSGFAELQKASDMLLSATCPMQLQNWDAGDLTVMNERLHSLMSLDDGSHKYMDDPDSAPTTSLPAQGSDIGEWRLLDHQSGWKSCPIGVYYSHQPAFDSDIV
ncbi:Las1-like-domain-containing protein [Suillus clintonianus]|uniref:Las1-like-domain-containing protein n=1 Tax=Suillus clintonianus TaxID=1904413 RepID=UPI001B870F3F|nr:Las1-like-domain-containing protein [Suillus clintonianus]KAG2123607.1 Las1-like-domain-containing protein [Suillus clintonianus]